MIVVRIGDVETPGRTEIDLDIKDKDLAGSSFFFFPPPYFPRCTPFKGLTRCPLLPPIYAMLRGEI